MIFLVNQTEAPSAIAPHHRSKKMKFVTHFKALTNIAPHHRGNKKYIYGFRRASRKSHVSQCDLQQIIFCFSSSSSSFPIPFGPQICFSLPLPFSSYSFLSPDLFLSSSSFLFLFLFVPRFVLAFACFAQTICFTV